MLKLTIGRSQPWRDSSGKLRSPIEEFWSLRDEIRGLVENRDSESPMVAWEIGVLSDGWPTPPESKVISVPNFQRPLHVMDLEEASSRVGTLLTLWQTVFECIRRVHPHTRIFVRDQFYQEDRGWVDFADALKAGTLEATEVKTKRLDGIGVIELLDGWEALTRLLKVWWPSMGGFIVGVDGASIEQLQTGSDNTGDLKRLTLLFETSTRFHNAGVVILSSESSTNALLDALATRGLTDGVSIDWLSPDYEP